MRREVIRELTRVVRLDSAGFFLVENDHFVRPCDLNIDRDRRAQYMEYFHQMSPFRPDKFKRVRRSVFQIDDLVARSRFEASPYYADHFRHLKVYYETGIFLRAEGRIIGFINLNRASPRRPFRRWELRLAEELAGHLPNPLRLHLVRERERREREVLQAASERHNCGILVLNQQFEPIYQNGRARQLLACLAAESSKEKGTAELLEKVRRTVSEQTGLNDTCHLTATTAKGKRLLVQAKKVCCGSVPEPQGYLVDMRELETGLTLNPESLRERYGLGDREIEVLSLVSQGLCNKEIADRLCISTWTVITHVKNVFEKMQVHNRTSAMQKALEY